MDASQKGRGSKKHRNHVQFGFRPMGSLKNYSSSKWISFDVEYDRPDESVWC